MLTRTAAKAWTPGSSELTYADDLYDDYDPDPDDYDDDDRYDEYKDDLAMGYINPDGSQRDPDPPEDPWDWHPSLRERIRWRISGWKRWNHRAKYHPDGYDDEPPF